MALILCSLVFFSPLSAPTSEAQIHAMARESSASASEQWGADELPLILCTDCGLRQVVRRRSKQEWSFGKVFYCCPLHKCDGSGCPFWFWEEDYVVKLRSLGLLKGGSSTQLEGPIAAPRMEFLHAREGEWKKKNATEIVRLLKSICVVCVSILCVQCVMLLLLVFKN
ncbi:hypothetical protein PVAP13_3KG018400 [Panicum virgatum]|uniref:GRF-type domain-containing protein n=1 Tax=Panicum virgatum TaxID=38727 RepID=A0A8T0ULB0_PANVG|nr:hypothetical protein PVAP13_3KG018400 [Panicum virgatum]